VRIGELTLWEEVETMGRMGRPLRIERAGGWYHVTGRGNERKAIYRDKRDRLHFLELVAEMVGRFRVVLHGYQLMDNHYHLIVEFTEKNLSRAGHWLGVSYTNWFNRRHRRSGHLFQGRFKSVVVDAAEWALALSRYVHLNPVRVKGLGLGKSEQRRMRAGGSSRPDPNLVKERIRRVRTEQWGSYQAYAGLAGKPEWLTCEVILGMLGGRPEERRQNYRKYVENAIGEGLPESPWEQLKEKAVLGGKEFLEMLRSEVKGNAREQRGVGRLAKARPKLAQVIEAVEKRKGERWLEFRDRHRDSGRDLVLYVGQRICGMKLGELAAAVGMKEYSAASAAIRRFEKRMNRSSAESKMFEQVCQMLNVET
jgi:REP-associated tyrosine transposase